MRKKIIFLMVLFALVCSKTAKAGDFFINCYGQSNNFWSSGYFQLPANLINSVLAVCTGHEGSSSWGLSYEALSLSEGGNGIHMKRGDYFGFKARDMFGHIHYGLKFGYQPKLLPFGFYAKCGYDFRQFRAQIFGSEFSKYKLNSIDPGIGVRLSPFMNRVAEGRSSLIFEIGAAYVCNLSCSAPYDGNKDQFGSGMTSDYGIGMRWESLSIVLGAELFHYNYFNQDFTPDGGLTYPYKNIKSKRFGVSLEFNIDF